MKKIFFNSSPVLRIVGHFNLIIGLLISLLFVYSNLSQASTNIWGSANKDIEISGDIIIPSNNTIINTNSWGSENNTIVIPVSTATQGTINTSNGVSGWNSENKEIKEPVGGGVVVGSLSSTVNNTNPSPSSTTIKISTTTVKLATTTSNTQSKIATTTKNIQKATSTNIVSKEIPTIQISTINSNAEENIKIDNDLKSGVAPKVDDKKSIPPSPFSTPIVNIGLQIENTMNIVNSFGTTSKKITEQTSIVKSEGVDLLYKDTNKDGISDYDSLYVYNIDPVKLSPTTEYEGKKITAGEKIFLGFDPTQTAFVKIGHEDPRGSSAKEMPTYKVDRVALTSDKQVTFKGRALPNSFVTIYIYSNPVIVTVKTDASGEWQYTLDKDLEDGQHTVYTATVNNTGKILAQSAPFAFEKTAESVTLIPPVKNTIINGRSEAWIGKYVLMITGFVILSVLAVLFVVFVGIRKDLGSVNEEKINDLQS